MKILPQQVPNDAPPAASIASGLPAAYPPQPQPQLQPQSPAPAQKGAKRRLGADATPLGADATISAEDGAAGLGGRTTTFLVDTIVGLKEDMRAMADQMCRMQKKMRKNAKQCKEHHHRHHRSDHHHHEQDGQSTHQVLRQLQRRVAQLEEDNSQLRNQLAHIAASRYGICASPAATTTALAATTFTSADTSSSSASSSPSSSPPGSWAMGDSFQGMRVVGGDGAGARYAGAPAEVETGLGREMLWCFPFLRHFDFSSRRFVVDDLQKAVVVLKVHPQGPTSRGFSSAVFANHQFCRVSGFSMAELLGRELVWVVSRHDKNRFLDAWLNGSRAGLSEIVPCCHQLEYKGGNLATIVARSQFFFSADEKRAPQLAYTVICVDQVLGVENLPYSIEEAQRKERAEWQDVRLHDRPAQAAAGQTPSGRALRPPPPPLPPPLMPVDHQQLALRAALQSPELEAHTTSTTGGHHVPPADVAAFGESWHDFLLPDDEDHLTTQTEYSAFAFSSAPSPLTSHLFPPT